MPRKPDGQSVRLPLCRRAFTNSTEFVNSIDYEIGYLGLALLIAAIGGAFSHILGLPLAGLVGYYAWTGQGPFATDGPQTDLRSVATLLL